MAELKAKITLQEPGDQAVFTVKQLTATLRWSAAVDLDLMAFYQTVDAQSGGVLSDQYPGGYLGRLDAFPYMQLSGDARPEDAGEDNCEILQIDRLDAMAQVFICALNYSDAVAKKTSRFADYDGGVVIHDRADHSIAVPLNASEPGHVAVIARLEPTESGEIRLINENRILDLNQFFQQIPGAKVLQSGAAASTPSQPATDTPVQERLRQAIRKRVLKSPYISKSHEKSLLQQAVADGFAFDEAHAFLLELCESEGGLLESLWEKQIGQMFEAVVQEKGQIDQDSFQAIIAQLRERSGNHLTEQQCQQQAKTIIEEHQWPVRQGFLKGGHWFDAI